jgi:two-component system CheB/CheR fusion protein
MPYRTMDNFISGAVLTFNLITHYKLLEYKFEAVQQHIANMMRMLSEAAVQLDAELNVLLVNRAFLKLFSLKEHQALHVPFLQIIVKYWQTELSGDVLNRYVMGSSVNSKPLRLSGSNGKMIELTITPFADVGTQAPLFFMVLIKEV